MHSFQHSSSEWSNALVFNNGEYQHLKEARDVEPSSMLLKSSVLRKALEPVGEMLAADEADGDVMARIMMSALRSLDCSHALVGELSGSDWSAVQTVTVVTKETVEQNFQYDLGGTPCAEVLSKTICVYPRDVAELFPEDVLLAQMGIESYVGVPLYDSSGRPLGLVIMLNQDSLDTLRALSVVRVLRELSPFLSRMLETRRRERDWAALLDVTRSLDVADFALNMATSLMTRGSFILSLSEPSEACSMTLVLDGEVEEREGVVLDEALERRLRTREFCKPEIVERAFAAGFEDVHARGVGHFLIVPLHDRHQTVIGAAGVFHQSALNPRLIIHPLISAFASHASFMLEEASYVRRRQRAERRMHELERLEGVGVLIGGVAHDFNNVISSVLGNAEYLIDFLRDDKREDVQESLADIRDAANTATTLCRQLMSYVGRSSDNSEVFCLNDEVKAVSRLAKATLGMSCHLSFSFLDEAVGISGDPLQIRQVVMNLLTNGEESLDSDGVLELKVSQVCLTQPRVLGGKRWLESGRYALLTVTDNGCGMPLEVQERMFEPFFTTKSKGNGLGLASVAEIVRSHNGGIDVHSTHGVGTRVDVYLPIHTSKVEADPLGERGPVEPLSLLKKKVLVIDDDEFIRELLKRFCQRSDLDVVVADCGESGISIYEQQGPDIGVVIMDLKMPGMSGLDALSHLKEVDPEVKVLMSTGHRTDFGDMPVLPKPFSYQEFHEAIELLLAD